jgi:hypothetical protein
VTGLEAPMYAALRFRLEKGRSIRFPQFRTAGPPTPYVDDGRFYGTTGVGPDLYVNAQNAARRSGSPHAASAGAALASRRSCT